ncbi:MAG: L-threonylcarbamoyladenylate synthase [Chitinophagales bacterium]
MKIGKNIAVAKAALEAGELVAIPTETVYGLAANALDSKSVVKIFEAKNRPFFNPLIVHIGLAENLEELTNSKPAYVDKLIEEFWPGPLTLVLPKSNKVPDIVSGGLDTVAVRMPNHAMTLELLQSLNFPLAAPSANPFKYISPTTAEHVAAQMGDKVSYILDGGACKVGVESTIVKCLDDKILLLREGKIQAEEIEAFTGIKAEKVKTNNEKPEAPGMLSTHYAPNSKILIGNIADLIEKYSDKKLGILSFSEKYTAENILYQEILSSKENLSEAAANFFSALRNLDAAHVDLILAEYLPEEGIGRAVNDRLRRASTI